MDDNKLFTPVALNYDCQDTFIFDREILPTRDKKLITGLLDMYSEGRHHGAVRLHKVWLEYELEGEFLYLILQELFTK